MLSVSAAPPISIRKLATLNHVTATAVVLATIAIGMLLSTQALADSDALASETVSFASADGAHVLDMTAANLHRVFEIFQPAVDSSSTITSPKVVSGSSSQPRVQVSIRACVFVICKTVDLDTDISIGNVAGSSMKNLLLKADLRRSTDLLSNNFDSLDVQIWLNPAANASRGSGSSRFTLKVVATAHHASGYSAGPVSSTALKMLKLQATPMIQALNQALIENGARDLAF